MNDEYFQRKAQIEEVVLSLRGASEDAWWRAFNVFKGLLLGLEYDRSLSLSDVAGQIDRACRVLQGLGAAPLWSEDASREQRQTEKELVLLRQQERKLLGTE